VFELVIALLLLSGPTEPLAPSPPSRPEVKPPTLPVVRGEVAAPPKAKETARDTMDAGSDVAVPAAEVAKPESTVEPKEKSGGASAEAATELYGKKNLCGELVKQGRDLAAGRKRLEDDRRAVEAERHALEKLRAEIADARVHLRAETAVLEGLLDKQGAVNEGIRVGAAHTPAESKAPTMIRTTELEAIARTMKSMKPDAAAALIQRSDPVLAAALLKRMKPAEAGAVLDRLKPDTAADLVSMMASTASSPKGAKP
jgi:flagellar motility protein MotE (MotC chaperone)